MDSKLRKLAIIGSLVMILLVSLLVVWGNGDHNRGSGGGTQDETPQESPEPPKQPATGVTGQVGDDLSAFMQDETFFDPEINSILEAARDQSDRLSLMVTSVEKDLRIQIVDNEGEPVTGESFYVSLRDMGEYKDLDKDGVIYIGDLDAGEYYVELLPIAGYHVPGNETRVHVKDKVEYVAIDDISLLIKTEADIDAEAEDTAVADAVSDADKTEIRNFQATSGNSRLGIDVSKWNQEIDWEAVKDAGVEFAIIRLGYRGMTQGLLQDDSRFQENMLGASNAGLKRGVYFFSQAVSEEEAKAEAEYVLEKLDGAELDEEVVTGQVEVTGDVLDDIDPGLLEVDDDDDE